MWRKILGTVGARYVVALLNLLLIFVNAKVLGAEGLGLVGILIASINLVTTFNSIFCGGTIVYFMHRYSLREVFIPAYIWALSGSVIATGILAIAGLFPIQYLPDVFLLAVAGSLITANSRFLLGEERVGAFNLIFMIQGGLLCPVLLLLYFGLGLKDTRAYLTGLYVANLTALAVSYRWLYKDLAKCFYISAKDFTHWREMFIYGLWGNVDNIAEVCTTRINYFFINRFLGFSGVGLLDGGTRISESVWHVSRAIGFLANSQVAREEKASLQRQTTLHLLRVTFAGTAVIVICILFIPEWVFTEYLFSHEFDGITSVIRGLSVGIVAFGCHTILSQYLIASGNVRYSAASSCVGLVTLLIAGFFLIPKYGIAGAAMTSSVAFTFMCGFSFWAFNHLSRKGIKQEQNKV